MTLVVHLMIFNWKEIFSVARGESLQRVIGPKQFWDGLVKSYVCLCLIRNFSAEIFLHALPFEKS